MRNVAAGLDDGKAWLKEDFGGECRCRGGAHQSISSYETGRYDDAFVYMNDYSWFSAY